MAPDSINSVGGEITVNGRRYALPKQPTVVVCIDGSEPGYVESAVEAGRAPWFARVLKNGTNLIADCVVPSFTNPNNLSIVTGRPPAVHGICGNYFLDPDTGKEVMMNDPKFLRVETLFPAFQRAGCRIAVVTAKDKLRGLLGKGLALGPGKACAFSSEKAQALPGPSVSPLPRRPRSLSLAVTTAMRQPARWKAGNRVSTRRNFGSFIITSLPVSGSRK